VREFLRILSRVFRAETAVAVLPDGEEAELWVGGLRPAPAATLRAVIDRAKREFEGRWGGKPARYAAKHEGLGAAGQLEMTLEDAPLETAAFSLSSSSRFLGAVVLARPEPLTEVETRLVATCLAQAAEALERMLLMEELHLSRETYRLMIDRIEDFIFTIDGEMRIVQANRAALRRLGYRRSQLGKIGLLDIVAPEHREAVRERLDRVLHREDFGRFLRVDLVPRDGKAFRAEVRATVMRRRSRRPMLIGVARDLTAQEEWELRSYTDPITGLVNRAKFGQLLERELGRLTRVRGRLTLMMIDLDYFKQVNDEFGHSEGDRVLRELGDVFRRTLRHTDIPARWGGDEFAVMLPHTGTDQALGEQQRLV
ncbi:MAG: diguanylate cyclase, partial [Candidatus Methylomirabilis sp.]|nr:diguanylate cyclase [Deltaproteobacteria bacterium]